MNVEFRILIVDDEPAYRDVLKSIVETEGYLADTAAAGQEAIEKLRSERYQLVLSDLMMEGMDGMELLGRLKQEHDDVEVIIITGYGTIENAVAAMKKGAHSYFIKGHAPEELLLEIEKVRKIVRLQQDNEILRDQRPQQNFLLRTNSKAFARVLDTAQKAAGSAVNILLLGESGVGKEVLAKYIHEHSDRKAGHFMEVNCHAFSENLLESELFGHEKGAFTGAAQRRIGRFEAASGGTLFLDEVGDIQISTQVKLLRVIESKKIERLGSNKSFTVDFRLISATNKNLKTEIVNGNFREDLYYRLSSMTINIPPLRERKEDLPMLIAFLFKKTQIRLKKEVTRIEDEVMETLLSYEYPGNIRELKNMIERLVVLAENGVAQICDLPDLKRPLQRQTGRTFFQSLREARNAFETNYIQQVLEHCEYNLSEAAHTLDISRRQLFNKMREYGLR